MKTAANAYFSTQVSTMSQGQLLIMLYEGCIKFLNQAKTSIEENDVAKKGMLITRAMDIINELDGSLNMQAGGEIAQNLHDLYYFCNTRLLKANLLMDPALIDEVIKIIDGVREGYAHIVNTPEAIEAMKNNKSVPSTQTTAHANSAVFNQQQAQPASQPARRTGAAMYQKMAGS
ncbi:flagellar export chaperone FliS [Halodesulfovibrio spirochaetisodalis]|uniref:Flagellar protein FliS n=1 Tax=Halodesulfovibrio spirochaetisodalis TaxID=1560234 RepID=A0A1B7XL67_9BACT|nr:flagellar export chaperone FliS [Halodesulfovibrio spirochaetisodalis]OBQ56241.1 flagellar protein FliS [Halodesulfovibrio spirochaetisodalis]